MNARNALFALTVGALVLASSDALAGGRRGAGKNAETIELSRPGGGDDADAAGTVRITHGARGDRTTIDLSHLARRTRYEVRDGDSGALLGTVRTNRKGRATFNLTRSLAKSASVGGSDGVSNVDIVDPSTGKPVLTGDVEPEPELPQYGSAAYENDKGDTADASLYSDPANSFESFSFNFFPAQDPSSTKYRYYDLYLDTAKDGKLPLGVESAADLAGRRFQVLGPDGAVLLDDKLPALEKFDDPWGGYDDGWYGDDWYGDDWGDDWNGGWDDGFWEGEDKPGQDGTYHPDKPEKPDSDKPNGDSLAFRPGVKPKKQGARDVESKGVELLIADAEGALQSAGFLNEQAYDVGDCPVIDYGDFDPFAGWGDGDLIGFLFPGDGTFGGKFDLAAFLSDLFGFDLSGHGWKPSGDVGSLFGGLKHNR